MLTTVRHLFLSHINPFHALAWYFLMIFFFNIILPHALHISSSSIWSPDTRRHKYQVLTTARHLFLSHINPFHALAWYFLVIFFYHHSATAFCHMPCISHPPRFGHPDHICLEAQFRKLPLYNFLHSPVISLFLVPNIFHYSPK